MTNLQRVVSPSWVAAAFVLSSYGLLFASLCYALPGLSGARSMLCLFGVWLLLQLSLVPLLLRMPRFGGGFGPALTAAIQFAVASLILDAVMASAALPRLHQLGIPISEGVSIWRAAQFVLGDFVGKILLVLLSAGDTSRS